MRKILLLLVFILVLGAMFIYPIVLVGEKKERECITNIIGGSLSHDRMYFSFSVTSKNDKSSCVETYMYSFGSSQVKRLEFTKMVLPSISYPPIWSSDSEMITYLTFTHADGIQRVCTYDMRIPQLSEQIIFSANVNNTRLSWPLKFTNSRIVFFIDEQNNHKGVYSINQNGEDMRWLSEMPEVSTVTPFPDSFIPGNKNIYCYGLRSYKTDKRGIFGIYSINIENGKYKELSNFTDDRARISIITYEPKSNHILIARSEPNEVFIINPSESNTIENTISLEDRNMSSAAWVNSEELICGDVKGSYKLNILTKKREILTQGEAVNYMGFIPDTKKVIGISKDNTSEEYSVWLMDTDGKNRHIIFPEPVPDGKTPNEQPKDKPVDGK